MDENNSLEFQNLYKEIFEKYILSKVDLNKYEEMINSSELGFGKANNVTLYSGLNEFLNYNHIYVLNNFYIEKLSDEEINILKNGSLDEKIDLVNKTYKKVVFYGDYSNVMINYMKDDAINHYSSADQLVIGIFYGSNTKMYNSKEGYLDNFRSKRDFMNDLSKQLSDDILKVLGLSTNIIVYKK